MRRGLLALAGATIVGTAAELATLRHWDGLEQLIPWGCLIAIGVVYTAYLLRPGRGCTRLARIASSALIAASAYGIWEHLAANRKAGALDRKWGAVWSQLSTLQQFRRALDGSVGPSPLLAPGALATVAILILLATIADGRGDASGRSSVASMPVGRDRGIDGGEDS